MLDEVKICGVDVTPRGARGVRCRDDHDVRSAKRLSTRIGRGQAVRQLQVIFGAVGESQLNDEEIRCARADVRGRGGRARQFQVAAERQGGGRGEAPGRARAEVGGRGARSTRADTASARWLLGHIPTRWVCAAAEV